MRWGVPSWLGFSMSCGVLVSCGTCENDSDLNKNLKRHWIRGWHIGLGEEVRWGVPSCLGSSHLSRPRQGIRRQMVTATSVISAVEQNKQEYIWKY